MSDHPQLRVGDYTIWQVSCRALELGMWSRARALWWLQEAAAEWPVRGALLRLSGAMLGPDDDLDRALAFLADAFERGRLVAIPTPDPFWGLARMGAGEPAWDDVPRLSDLRPPSARRDDATADGDPATPPTVDPWTTFVAFIIVDQQGKPLTGRSRCTVDAMPHVHAIEGIVVDLRPIAAHARIKLALEDLAYTPEAGQ